MKFKHINPRNVAHLIPAWAFDPFCLARSLDDALDQYWSDREKLEWDKRLGIRIEIPIGPGKNELKIVEPDDVGSPNAGIGRLVLECDEWAISILINDILKGCPDMDGLHCVYIHQFPDGHVNQYVGVTKQRWFERLAQHESSARNDSPFLFHRALRHRQGQKITHFILVAGVTYDHAMELEEEFVELCGLYPRGLNMIPGGLAGLKYLHKLGVNAKNVQERDEALETLTRSEKVGGHANPLCAARWSTDQSYINKVICGHSGRLTIDQVRMIRILSGSGWEPEHIATRIGDTSRRVRRVLKDSVYARVA